MRMKATNEALTIRQATLTGERWCMSCSKYRKLDGGLFRTISAGRLRVKQQWRCAVCLSKRNGEEIRMKSNPKVTVRCAGKIHGGWDTERACIDCRHHNAPRVDGAVWITPPPVEPCPIRAQKR